MSINKNKNTNTLTVKETVNNHSPRHQDTGTGGSKSPRSGSTEKGVVAPWTQIVRGAESEMIAVKPSSPVAVVAESQGMAATADSVEGTVENGPGPNGNDGKRRAWNKPSNGEIVPVMGADSWPPLLDSARASSKSSPDPLKELDGSYSSLPFPAGQGPGTATNLATTTPARQKHNFGNSNESSNHPSPRSGFVLNDNDQPRNSFRNRNGGRHSRGGDGSYRHNVAKRDQERENFHRRDLQQQRSMQRLRHLPPQQARPNSMAYIGPPPMRPPFPAPMAFPDFVPPVYFYHPPESLRGMPLVAPISPTFFPAPDPIYSKIVEQINYWFSGDNLAKDIYLRKNMDDEGWVSIELIAGFNKVAELTSNIQLILDALRSSTVVEVQGNKIRRRNDWERWIMPQSTLTVGVQSISLEDKTSNQADTHLEAFLSKSSSHYANNPSEEQSDEEKKDC